METIAVVGGTGKLGGALARRWAKAGLNVIIGSRNAEAALAAAAEMGFGITGMSNAAAAAQGDIIVITVPFAAQEGTISDIAPHLQGKLVVDTTVPLMPPKVMQMQMPAEGSAAQRAQRLLGAGVTLVSAFHNVAAHKLATDENLDCDVLVFGADKMARRKVIGLANAAGLRGLHGGALGNSAAAEGLTSIFIFLNKTYQVDGAGIRITGTLVEPAS